MVCETNTLISSVRSILAMLQPRQSSCILPKQAVLYFLCSWWATGTVAIRPHHSAELFLFPLVIMSSIIYLCYNMRLSNALITISPCQGVGFFVFAIEVYNITVKIAVCFPTVFVHLILWRRLPI